MWLGFVGAGDRGSLSALAGERAVITIGEQVAVAVSGPEGPAIHADTRRSEDRFTFSTGAGSIIEIDPAAGSIRIRRDPFGIDSIYYARRGGTLWFSTDLKLLLTCVPTSGLNYRALHGYLAFSYVPAPETLYSGIHLLPAGATLVCDAESHRIEPAPSWACASTPSNSQDQAIDQLRELLTLSVLRCLGAAKRVGIFLSGGLDSSLIAALLARAGAAPVCFTLDFGPEAHSADLDCAKQVAAQLGCPLRIVPARAAQIRSALPEVANACRQPFGDAVTAPLMLLCRAAAGEVDTIFNGEGGDQLFGGWANKPMIAAETYGGQGYSRERAYLQTFHRFLGLEGRLYTPRLLAEAAEQDVEEWIQPALHTGGYGSLIHQLRAANLILKGAQNIVPRAIALAAGQRLQIRMPFFDLELAKWSFSLPSEWLLQGACEKYLLKCAFADLLPAGVVWREKRGMGAPATAWLMGGLQRDAARILNERTVRTEGLFRWEYVKSLLQGEDEAGEIRRRRVGEKLWSLMMYHLWRKEFMPV